MKTMHNTIRAWSIGIGLALLLAASTAAMMGVFSGAVPAPGLYPPVAIAPAQEAAGQPVGSDTLLYERVARSDGSHQWVLTEEFGATLSTPVAADTLATLPSTTDAGGLQNVSYTLLAKPAGLNKVIKNCNTYSAATKSRAYDAYDISCNTMG